jgi:RNA polymerase sigma factor (sigma-70 family)
MASTALKVNSAIIADPTESVARGEALLLMHTALVRRIAYHLFRRRHYVDVDDLIRAGMIGLLEAIRWYGHETAGAFQSYASECIRDAMLAFVRGSDWSPRSVRPSLQGIEDQEKAASGRSA